MPVSSPPGENARPFPVTEKLRAFEMRIKMLLS
jgi:hypothetical protein